MKNKDLKHSDNRVFKYFLISIGILAALFIAITSFVLTGWGTDILSEWREGLIREVIEVEEEPLIIEEEEAEAVAEPVKPEEKKDRETPEGIKIDYEELTAEDFFPLKISIPKIEVDELVYEGHDDDTLKTGPGHITVTPLPGDEGRCAISGHRTLYGAPFSRVDELENGDLIYLETSNDISFTFIVTAKEVVEPEDVHVLNGTGKRELLLTTCHPKYSAAKRLIIVSELLKVFSFEME